VFVAAVDDEGFLGRHAEHNTHQRHPAAGGGEEPAGSLQRELERYADEGEDGPAGQQRPPVHALRLGRGSGGCGEDR
jgi:hypothetical protein